MTKRRRLTKIRVSETSSFSINEEHRSDANVEGSVGRRPNTNLGTRNEEIHTSDMSNEETRLHTSDILEPFSEDSADESDALQHSVKRRGPTILADIWNQPQDEKWVVKFNSQGQPYGDESSLLSSFIGTIGRNPEMAPQGYSDWRLVPMEYKVKCMNEIKLRFVFPRCGEDHIQKALGRTVKDFRGELKAMYYEPNKHNRTELVNAKPPRVPKDQWLKLLSYWDQDKTKRRAAINRINQKNQSMPHCAGRQSFAQLRAKKTINGVEPSRAQIFIDTHKDRKTRDKKKIDEQSAKAVELMNEKLQELPDGIEQVNGRIAWKGDIFDQVLGKEETNGRVRGVGGGISASKLWGSSDVHRSSDYLDNNDGSNELILKLIDDMKQMQEKHSEEMQDLQEKRNAEMKEVLDKQNKLESYITDLIKLFNERAPTNNQRRRFSEREYNNSTNLA